MAEISRPWDGIVLGDAGPYSATNWQSSWGAFRGPNYRVADVTHTGFQPGVFKDQLNELGLAVANNLVTINTGRAQVDGVWYENNVAVPIAVATEAANARIDRIVLRKDNGTQTARIVVITGVPGTPPAVPPLVHNVGVQWDLPLWQVYMTLGVALPAIWRDERDYIGQYEPTGIDGEKVYVEDDIFTREVMANLYSFGNFLTEIVGGCTLDQIVEAGFGSGGLAFEHDGIGTNDRCGITSALYKPDLINARMRWRIKNPDLDINLDRVLGFMSQVASLTPANGVYFRADGAANWFAVTRAGGVETATPTGQALDNTWRVFEIRQTGDDVVVFLIDGVVVATHVTNIPSDVALTLNAHTFDNGAAPAAHEYMHADWVKVQGDR